MLLVFNQISAIQRYFIIEIVNFLLFLISLLRKTHTYCTIVLFHLLCLSFVRVSIVILKRVSRTCTFYYATFTLFHKGRKGRIQNGNVTGQALSNFVDIKAAYKIFSYNL